MLLNIAASLKRHKLQRYGTVKELQGQNSSFSSLTISIISFKLLLRIGTLSEMLSGANKDLKTSALTDGNKAKVLHLLSHPLLWYVLV